METNRSLPLPIAIVEPLAGQGFIGWPMCPGEKQPASAFAPWAGDLEDDLYSIQQWNAAAVVSLLEDHELTELNVGRLGDLIRAAHMQWFHLPIKDGSAPEPSFEKAWKQASESLRALVRSGANVFIHCKGGVGRPGTVAARLSVELGMQPEEAITLARLTRPRSINDPLHEEHVRKTEYICEPDPALSDEAVRDRAVGSILGLAVGDAIGTTLEFSKRDSAPRVTDMIGGGPFRLAPGQWTDDTSMALALMESLLEFPELNERDLMERFCRWFRTGEFSSTGRCFDIGMTTRSALIEFERTGNPVAGPTAWHSAGNGSLMRLAPVAVRHWQKPDLLAEIARRQSKTTHGAEDAVEACAAFALVLGEAIGGVKRSEVLRRRKDLNHQPVADIMGGTWRDLAREEVGSSGYVLETLEAAMWCVARTPSFADAVLLAANLGDDADTTAAVTGQLAGALYGASGIPRRWRKMLAWSQHIEAKTSELFAASITSTFAASP